LKKKTGGGKRWTRDSLTSRGEKKGLGGKNQGGRRRKCQPLKDVELARPGRKDNPMEKRDLVGEQKEGDHEGNRARKMLIEKGEDFLHGGRGRDKGTAEGVSYGRCGEDCGKHRLALGTTREHGGRGGRGGRRPGKRGMELNASPQLKEKKKHRPLIGGPPPAHRH